MQVRRIVILSKRSLDTNQHRRNPKTSGDAFEYSFFFFDVNNDPAFYIFIICACSANVTSDMQHAKRCSGSNRAGLPKWFTLSLKLALDWSSAFVLLQSCYYFVSRPVDNNTVCAYRV